MKLPPDLMLPRPAIDPDLVTSLGRRRSLLLMVDPAEVLQDSTARHTERGQLQRDWIIFSAECGRRAQQALAKAAEGLAQDVPGRRPDAEVAQAWAAVGQGWATLSHAEAARSVAAAAFTVDQVGISVYS